MREADSSWQLAGNMFGHVHARQRKLTNADRKTANDKTALEKNVLNTQNVQ